jgi:hypothetical protein
MEPGFQNGEKRNRNTRTWECVAEKTRWIKRAEAADWLDRMRLHLVDTDGFRSRN